MRRRAGQLTVDDLADIGPGRALLRPAARTPAPRQPTAISSGGRPSSAIVSSMIATSGCSGADDAVVAVRARRPGQGEAEVVTLSTTSSQVLR